MKRPDLATRLRHMLDAARNARLFADGKTRIDLDADLKLQLALTRLIEIIGEAAKAVPEDGGAQRTARRIFMCALSSAPGQGVRIFGHGARSHQVARVAKARKRADARRFEV